MSRDPFAPDKLYWHIDRLQQVAESGDATPVTVEMDPSNVCTNKCLCCAGGRKRPNALLDRTRMLDLIAELEDMGVRAVTITGGGEPLCNPSTMEIISRIGQGPMDVSLITNGVMLDRVPARVLAPCTWTRVSLDAVNADEYRRGQGVDHFHRVCGNIHRLAIGGLEGTFGAGYLVDADRLDHIETAAALGAALGVDYMQFRPFHHAITADPEFVGKLFDRLNAAKRYEREDYRVVWSGKFTRMQEDDVARPYTRCMGSPLTSVIGADGEVYVCCHLRGMDRYSFGSIYKHSFREIWQSDRRQEVMRNIDFADCPPLCRCDPMNRILWNLTQNEPHHMNFL